MSVIKVGRWERGAVAAHVYVALGDEGSAATRQGGNCTDQVGCNQGGNAEMYVRSCTVCRLLYLNTSHFQFRTLHRAINVKMQ